MPEDVFDNRGLESKPEMSTAGVVVAAGSLLMLVPVAPFLGVLWVADSLGGESREDEIAAELDAVEPAAEPPE